jgi:hypothetical protein
LGKFESFFVVMLMTRQSRTKTLLRHKKNNIDHDGL